MTAEEILRQSGITDEQIGALGPKAITAFSNVLSQAQQAREAAELAQRSNVDFYENRIAPSLLAWDEEKQRLDQERSRLAAENAYYREAARSAGVDVADAPGQQPRDQGGRYVAGAPGGTPGSPTYINVEQIAQRAGDAIGIISDISWEHEKLFGQKLPISPSELIRQADQVRMDPRSYAARQFNWDKRREEMQRQEQEKHDAKIRADAAAERDKHWAERVGSNPDIRQPQANPRMTDIARAVRGGERGDPIMMNEGERRRATAVAIRTDLAEETR